MLRQAADGLPLAVRARLPVDMALHAAEEGLLRQQAVAEDHGAIQIVGLIAHAVGAVALNGLHPGGRAPRCRDQLRHDAHMMRNAVLIEAEEDQIARAGDIGLLNAVRVHRAGGAVQVERLPRELIDPVLTAGADGELRLRHARIVEAEGNIDGAPRAVRRAVPRAIPRVALAGHAILLIDDEVFRALGIAKLRSRDGEQILPPLAGQLCAGDGPLPHLRGLNVRRRVRIADGAVGVLLLRADKGPCAVAERTVPVLLALGKAARQGLCIRGGINDREAIRIVDMLQHLRLAADDRAMAEAGVRVLVEEDLPPAADRHRLGGRFRGRGGRFSARRPIRLPAGQRLFPCVAAVRMGVPLRFRQRAGQFPQRFIAALGVLVLLALREGTDQGGALRIAAFAVDMAVALRFRADQRAAREGEAGLRVDVLLRGGRRREAALAVRVRPNLRQRAPEVPVGVVAGVVVRVHDKIGIAADRLAVSVIACACMVMDVQRIPRAGQNRLRGGGHLLVAGQIVGVLRNLALLLLHRDRGQDERIDRAEDDHRREAGDHTVPPPPAPARFDVSIGTLQAILLHCSIHQPLYCKAPKPASGQTRNTILPTICSSATQPTAVLRESTDVALWSPRQK